MIIILLGAPGAGKGTISKVLKDQYGFIHLSTGDIFRKTIAQDTPLAKELKQIMQSGNLIDDDMTNEVVRQELMRINDKNANIILDGYPRNTNQLDYLSGLTHIDYALDMVVPQDILIKRITGRRVCPVCKETYNIYFKKPKLENRCDKDGSLLEQRKDDAESAVAVRFKTYQELNAPLVSKCKDLKIYHAIDNQNLEEAIKQIKEICKFK